jgi:hypothetical protein
MSYSYLFKVRVKNPEKFGFGIIEDLESRGFPAGLLIVSCWHQQLCVIAATF